MRYTCTIAVAFALASCGRQAPREVSPGHRPQPRLFQLWESSPSELLKRNEDGTLLLKIRPRPHARYGEPGGTERVGDETVYYSLSFRIEDVPYAAGWRMRSGSAFPPWLDSEKEFRYLVRPWRTSADRNVAVFCTVLKVWHGDRLVLGSVEGQPAARQVTRPGG